MGQPAQLEELDPALSMADAWYFCSQPQLTQGRWTQAAEPEASPPANPISIRRRRQSITDSQAQRVPLGNLRSFEACAPSLQHSYALHGPPAFVERRADAYREA